MVATTRSSRTSKDAAAAITSPPEKTPSTAVESRSTTESNDRTYRKLSPKPQLQQITFPARRTTVRSKKTTTQHVPASKRQQRRSLPASLGGSSKNTRSSGVGSGSKDPKQSTLTQIGWKIPSTYPEDEDDDGEDGGASVVDLTKSSISNDEEDGRSDTRNVVATTKSVQKTRKAKVEKLTTTASAANRGRKRRKTTGTLEPDALEEEDDVQGGVIPSSRYYTQTLTQMPSWCPSGEGEDEDGGLAAMVVGDSEDEFDDGRFIMEEDEDNVYDKTTPSKKRKRPSPSPSNLDSSTGALPMAPPLPNQTSLAPQTPSKQRSDRTEIPSSQPSPFTPNLDIAQRNWSPLALGMDRTPLKDRSSNVDAPMPSMSGRLLKTRKSEVPDSWSSVNGGLGSSPLASGSSQARKLKRTPLKEISFVDVEGSAMGDVSLELGEHREAHEGYPEDRASQRIQRADDEVIVDSDEEFQGFPDDEIEAPSTPSPSRTRSDHIAGAAGSKAGPSGSQGQQAATHRPASQPASQPTPTKAQLAEVVGSHDEEPVISTPPAQDLVLEKTMSGAPVQETPGFECPVNTAEVHPQDPGTPGTPVPPLRKAGTQQLSSQISRHRKSTPEPPADEDDTEPETPSHKPWRRSSSIAVDKETPISSPQKTSPAMPPVSQIGYSYKSQAFESQRVPFEMIRQMAPQTDRSDVIMSIHPEHVQRITDGTKTHEFRNYRLPQTVARIWIYITHPIQQLKYMAIISGFKLPGEIAAEDPGVGNQAFNEGEGTKYAYELKQVYQLNNPVSLQRMKENGWVEQAPQKYEYVPPAVLGELMGNLRCALFEEHEHGESSGSQSQGGVTVSQELAEQLRGDIAHTQLRAQPSSPPHEPGQDEMDGVNDNIEEALIVRSSEGTEAEDEHITATPPHTIQSSSTRQKGVALAKPPAPLTHSQQSVLQIDDSPVAARFSQSQHRPTQTQHIVKSTVRPSQATTASASSQSQQVISQQHQQPQRRTPAWRAQRYSSMEEDDVVVVDDSPVQMRTSHLHTQSSLGLGSLLRSSQGYGLGGQDSLMDDSRIRMPPADGEIIWDSEGE